MLLVAWTVSAHPFSGLSNTVAVNMSVVTGGGYNSTSNIAGGGVIIGLAFQGRFIVTSIDVNGSVGFFETVDRTASFTEAFITGYVWNSTEWVRTTQEDFLDVINFRCPLTLVDCEPAFQGLSPGLNNSGQNSSISINQSILNITNTGVVNITQIDFRINDTCSGINLSFSNSSKVKVDLNTSFNLAHGHINVTDSKVIYLYANASPGGTCPSLRMIWQATQQ